MLESFNSGKFEYKRLTEAEQNARGILGRLVGVIADTKNSTRNGRKYSRDLWEKVFNNDIMKEKIANRACFGELGHPETREETDMEKIAICLAEQPKIGSDGKVYGVFDILSTPNGRILKSLCDYGCTIGVSSRGTGDLYTDDDGNEAVDPDTYNCEAWDAVIIPAVKEARLQYVTESLDKKRYNKSLRQSLSESLNKANEEDKRIMEETLNNLGIKLSEPVDEVLISKLRDSQGINESDEEEDKEETFDITYEKDGAVKKTSVEAPDEGTAKDKFETKHIEDPVDDYEVVKESYIYTNPEHLNEVRNYYESKGVTLTQEDYDFIATNMSSTTLNEAVIIGDSSDVYNQLSDKAIDVLDRSDSIWVNVKNGVYYLNDEYDSTPFNTVAELNSTLENTADEWAKEGTLVKESYSMVSEPNEKATTSAIQVLDTIDSLASKCETDEERFDLLQGLVDQIKSLAEDEYDLLIESINDNKECNGENCTDKEKDKEVVNDKSDKGLVAEFQESLKQIKQLEEDNLSLKEQLSVCIAKESDLKEETNRYKKAVASLSDTAKKVKPLTESLNKKDKLIQSNKTQIQTLTESISKVEQLEQNQTNLNGQLQDLTKQLEESQKQLAKYRKSYRALKESYLEVQASNCGVRKEDLVSQLNESYSIRDINEACEKLAKRKNTLDKLPFIINENTKVSVSGSSNEFVKRPTNSDDIVSESLFELAGLK